MTVADHERAEARREQVLDAAAECFHACGFHAASIAKIAKAAGMSPGHIYNLFENKDDIIATIVRRDQAERLAIVDGIHRADDVARAMIERVDRGVEQQLAACCGALQLEVLAEAGRNPKLAEVVRETDAISRDKLCRLMDAALAQRDVGLDAKEVGARVEVMMALFDGLLMRTVRNPGVDRDAIAPVVRRLVAALLDE